MTLAAEKQMEHMGETRAIADHDHDLIHELSKRVDAVWRYDQYIANAKNDEHRQFWEAVKQQDEQIVEQLKKMVKEEVSSECF